MEIGGLTDSMLTKKVNAIVNCYFLSSVFPQLQINVNREVALAVVKSSKTSVHIFKDAEVSICTGQAVPCMHYTVYYGACYYIAFKKKIGVKTK